MYFNSRELRVWLTLKLSRSLTQPFQLLSVLKSLVLMWQLPQNTVVLVRWIARAQRLLASSGVLHLSLWIRWQPIQITPQLKIQQWVGELGLFTERHIHLSTTILAIGLELLGVLFLQPLSIVWWLILLTIMDFWTFTTRLDTWVHTSNKTKLS